ncbi:MAG: phosphate acyltransferase PlsX [Actinobacteria bacterium]|uniref:phosphate acyltransferase n=1 Tax=freshwater metagenome TaxID=449393 RepID=A0A6J5ZW97_9ZZZZ|nr:phosphate acyltransferase PlsX [Actinomycetota bacterium]
MGVTVAVDANGADLGPAEVAAGAAIAAERGVTVRIYGPADKIGEVVEGIEVIDAPVSIAKDADPARAARSTPDASIVQAARAVAEGEADALVSAGATGATLAAGLFEIRRARGIYRPALATPIPIPGNPVTMLDVGANVEVRSEHLVQFAYMGAALATTVLAQERPRVALLSNGREASRGTALVIEAGQELAAARNANFDFVGNIEGNDIAEGVADVVVTDGFTGNISLKLMEGISQAVVGGIRDAATSSARGKLGGALLRPALRGFRDEIDPEGPGGAYLLGLRRLAVVSHGRFSRYGFSQAILLAARAVSGDLVGQTYAALESGGALRRKGPQQTD